MANVTVYVVTNWQNLPTKTSAIDATNLNHIEQGIKAVTDFINTLNVESGKYLCQVAFTTAMKNKLDGIEAQANKYTLPTASNNTLGGVKVDGTTIVIDANGIISSNGGNLSTLLDVNFDDLEDGQIIKYDENTGKWINTSEADVKTKISELTDVQLTDLENGEILKWDEAAEKWVNAQNGEVLSYDETLDVLGLPANPVYRYRELISTDGTSGVASAGSITSGYEAYKAFDGVWSNNNDRWVTQANVYDSYLQYEFNSQTKVDKMKIQFGDLLSTYHDCNITVQGSNDGSNWTDLLAFTLLAADNKKVNDYIISESNYYTHYRIQFDSYNILVASNNYKYNGILNMQMYEKYLA